MTRPIQSMTGSSAESLSVPGFNLQIELKSVNSRFLDLSFKLADEVRMLESALRERLVGAFLRGKIECKIILKATPGTASATSEEQIDPQALAGLVGAPGTGFASFASGHAPQRGRSVALARHAARDQCAG